MGGERRAFHVFQHDDVIMVALLIGLSLCATHVEGGAIAQKDMSVYSERCVDHSFKVEDAVDTSCNTSLRQVFNILSVGDSTVLLGSTDCLYALDTNMMYVASVNISADQTGCEFAISNDIEQFICKNYFNFGIERNSSSLYVCGTDRGQYPRCWECSLSDGTLSCDDRNITTFNMALNPLRNHTILMTNDKLFVGGSDELPAENPIFSKVDVSSGVAEVNTSSSNNLWISAPKDFVGDPIEYSDHVYFFYREKAEENTIENRIYSRVARVCKNDTGGLTSPLDGEFTTFLKTRLLCSYGQLYPAMYDEIQDVERSTTDSDIIYALFTTPNAGTVSSAICRYSLLELKELFDNSDRRGQPTTTSSWQRITRDADDTLIRRQCQSSYPAITDVYEHLEGFPLMNYNALNCGFDLSCNDYSGRSADDPLAILEGIAGQRLALKNETNDYIAVYVGTNNRTIYRVDINSTTARITQRVTVQPDTYITDTDQLATKWPYGISDLIIRNDVVYGTIDDFAFTFPASEPSTVQSTWNTIVSLSEDKEYTFPANISDLVQTNIFKVFEAPEGSEITASLSGGLLNDSLTLTSSRFNVVSPSGNKEVLHCTIQVQDLTADVTMVTVNLTVTSMTDMTLTRTIPITVIHDVSERYVPPPNNTNLTKVNEYDYELAKYKYNFTIWLETDVKDCVDTCPSDCSSSSTCTNVP